MNCCAGTHDVVGAVVNGTAQGVQISVHYSEQTDAGGALLMLVQTNNGIISLIPLVLNRSVSADYSLPISLNPGQYRVLIYDIEGDGTLSQGVGYPAVTEELSIKRSTQGS